MRALSRVPPIRAVYKSTSELGTPLYTEDRQLGFNGVLYGEAGSFHCTYSSLLCSVAGGSRVCI